jgi:4-amino-4-deoxy-L-arabinose transferase-like glycosyltransferase
LRQHQEAGSGALLAYLPAQEEQKPAMHTRSAPARQIGEKKTPIPSGKMDSSAKLPKPASNSETGLTARKDWFWLVLLLLPPILLFPRLGGACLWQDEAETAMIGRAILAHGYPLASVGPNTITDQPGHVDLNSSGVWIWAPWLPGYIAALGMALCGVTAFAARLPFAIMGWGVLLVQYAALKDITRNRRLSRYATVLLLASIPFLLHARQCRYYMLLIFFTLIQLWGYVRMTRQQANGTWMFLGGGIGLYYSWYPQAAVLLLATGVHACILHRNVRFLRRLFLSWAGIGAGTLPFFFFTQAWSRDYMGTGHNYEELWRYLGGLRAYLIQIHVYFWPALLALPLLGMRRSKSAADRFRAKRIRIAIFVILLFAAACFPPGPWSLSLMGCALAAAGMEVITFFRSPSEACRGLALRDEWILLILVAAFACLIIAGLAPYPFFRYYLGLFPVFSILTAVTVLELARGKPWLSIALMVCLLSCNLIQLGPLALLTRAVQATGLASPEDYRNDFGYLPNNMNAVLALRLAAPHGGLQSPAAGYFQEITHNYVGPISGVVRYLHAHAKSNENILTTYEHFPLMFHTDLKVFSIHLQDDVPDYPDWVLMHGNVRPVFAGRLAQALRNPAEYEPAPVEAHEYGWENSPEPVFHLFRSPEGGAPVKLFHHVKPPG